MRASTACARATREVSTAVCVSFSTSVNEKYKCKHLGCTIQLTALRHSRSSRSGTAPTNLGWQILPGNTTVRALFHLLNTTGFSKKCGYMNKILHLPHCVFWSAFVQCGKFGALCTEAF